jgi:lambda repressor-like predicted transcriptional regulator
MVELLGYYSSQTFWTNRVKEALASRPRVTTARTQRVKVRKLTSDEVSELVAGYKTGASVYELARQFAIHRVTVSEHLHRRGIEMRRQGLDLRQVDEAAWLYEQGWSLARIASKDEVDPATVWRALRARSVHMRDTQGRVR